MKKSLRFIAMAVLVIFAFSFVLLTQVGEKKVQGATNEITFWSWVSDSDTIKQVYEQAIKEFNSNNKYGVKIKAVYTPGEQYKTKLQTAMAANNPPDILNMWAAGKMKPYVDANRLYSISDIMNKDKQWKDRYVNGVFDLTTFNGKIYGIPQIRVATVIYYNKEIFKKYNLTPPKKWSELVNVIKVLTKNGIIPFALDARDPWILAMYAEYIANRIDPDAYRKVQKDPNAWTDKAFIETGKKIQELVKLGAFPKGATSLDYVAARNLFDQGKAAMYVMGIWDVGYLSTQSPVKNKVGAFKWPEIEGGKGNINNFLAGIEQVIAISSNCKNKQAAAAWLKLLSEQKYAKDLLAEKAGYFPTVKVNPDPKKVTGLYLEVLNMLKDQNTKDSFTYYDVMFGPIIGDGFNNTIQSIYLGKDPVEAFKKLAEIAKKEMKK